MAEPRKRFDRAVKTNPAAVVSLDIRDGEKREAIKLIRPDERIAGIFEDYVTAQ